MMLLVRPKSNLDFAIFSPCRFTSTPFKLLPPLRHISWQRRQKETGGKRRRTQKAN